MICFKHSYVKQATLVSEKGFNETLTKTNETVFELYEKTFSIQKCSKCGHVKRTQVLEKIINCTQDEYLSIEESDKEFTSRYRNLILPKKTTTKKKDNETVE